MDQFKSKLGIVNNYNYLSIIQDYGDYLSDEKQKDCISTYKHYKLYRNAIGLSLLGGVVSGANLIITAKELDKLNELKKIKKKIMIKIVKCLFNLFD